MAVSGGGNYGEFATNGMTEQQQIDYWRKYAKQNAKMERLAYVVMMRAFRKISADILQSITDNGVDYTLANIDALVPRSAINNAYQEIYIRVGVAHKKWTDVDVKERFLQKKEERAPRSPFSFLRTNRPEPVQVEGNIELGFFNAQWLARLKQIVENIDVIERVNSVRHTIADRFRKSISNAQQEFVTITKIKARLRQDFKELTPKSAERIARTEVTYINNIAAEQSAVETGLDLVKTWIRTLDSRTRDAHRNVSRKPIKSTEKFKVGGKDMDKPGDPNGGLDNIINCRCSVAYLPADDYEDLLDDDGNFQRF